MDEKRGNRQAEYLRVSMALKGLQEVKEVVIQKVPQDNAPWVDRLSMAIEYLEERQVKVSPRC